MKEIYRRKLLTFEAPLAVKRRALALSSRESESALIQTPVFLDS